MLTFTTAGSFSRGAHLLQRLGSASHVRVPGCRQSMCAASEGLLCACLQLVQQLLLLLCQPLLMQSPRLNKKHAGYPAPAAPDKLLSALAHGTLSHAAAAQPWHQVDDVSQRSSARQRRRASSAPAADGDVGQHPCSTETMQPCVCTSVCSHRLASNTVTHSLAGRQAAGVCLHWLLTSWGPTDRPTWV